MRMLCLATNLWLPRNLGRKLGILGDALVGPPNLKVPHLGGICLIATKFSKFPKLRYRCGAAVFFMVKVKHCLLLGCSNDMYQSGNLMLQKVKNRESDASESHNPRK
jgi:hypothetical protein